MKGGQKDLDELEMEEGPGPGEYVPSQTLGGEALQQD